MTFKQYFEDLREMAEKCDWTLLDKFIIEHIDTFEPNEGTGLLNMDDDLKKMTFVKTVEGLDNISQKLKDYVKELRNEVLGSENHSA